MMEDIKAVDIMNYPWYFDVEERRAYFSANDWQPVFKTTFKKVGNLENAIKYFGVPSFEAMLQEMDEAGYDKVFITAFKQWSYIDHKLISNYSIEKLKKFIDKSDGRLIGAVSYNPFKIKESLQEVKKAIVDYDFKYVYCHSLGFGLPPNDRRYYPLYTLALEYDVPVGFQTGHSAEIMPSDVGRPIYIDRVALDFPDVKFILSHTGWPWIDEWIAMVWKHPNVYGDISSYPPRALPEKDKLIEFMNSWRGEDKVLFGTNGLGLKRCKQQFMELPLKDEVKRKILRENALRVFNL